MLDAHQEKIEELLKKEGYACVHISTRRLIKEKAMHRRASTYLDAQDKAIPYDALIVTTKRADRFLSQMWYKKKEVT